jgi:hypothetical protein
MSLIALAINLTCNDISHQNVDACSKALEATARQVNVYQDSENFENSVKNYARNYAIKTSVNYLGKPVVEVVGGVVYVYKVIQDRSIDFRLPTLGLCDSASNRITTNSYTLNLKWNIPVTLK